MFAHKAMAQLMLRLSLSYLCMVAMETHFILLFVKKTTFYPLTGSNFFYKAVPGVH